MPSPAPSVWKTRRRFGRCFASTSEEEDDAAVADKHVVQHVVLYRLPATASTATSGYGLPGSLIWQRQLTLRDMHKVESIASNGVVVLAGWR